MEENGSGKYRMQLYLAFFLITLITFYPLFFTGIGCGDDLHDYLTALKGNFAENARGTALISGRFYFLLVMPVHNLPWLWDNMVIVKLFQLLPIIVCFILFAVIVYKFTRSKESAFLFFLFTISLSQISGHTSLFVTYPFFFTFSLSLLLLSFIFLQAFLEKKKNKFLIISSLLFLIGVVFYEDYLLFLLFVAPLIIAHHIQADETTKEKIKKSLFQISPYFLIVILYLAAYIIFRKSHPSNYTGTTFDLTTVTIGSFFNSLWSLSYTALPTKVFEIYRTFFTEKSDLISGFRPVVLDVMLHGNIVWIVKGILVSLCGYFLLINLGKINIKTLIFGICAGILLTFTPHIPLALTSKYQFYISYGMVGYVTTFFSLFGVLLVITMLVSLLMNLIVNFRFIKNIVAAIVVVILFGCSIITDYTNDMVAKDLQRANVPFRAVDELINSETFKSIPPFSSIYMSDLYQNYSPTAPNLLSQGFNWNQYISEKTGRGYLCSANTKKFSSTLDDKNRQLYYVNAKQAAKGESMFIAIGRFDREDFVDSALKKVYTNRALFVYYSPYKCFSISFKCKDDPLLPTIPIKIKHIQDTIQPGRTVNFTIYNTHFNEPATVFTIDAWAIDMKSFMVSDIVNPEDKVIYL